eukprot:6194847-Pleurochrysis_carterae.AAC.1
MNVQGSTPAQEVPLHREQAVACCRTSSCVHTPSPIVAAAKTLTSESEVYYLRPDEVQVRDILSDDRRKAICCVSLRCNYEDQA